MLKTGWRQATILGSVGPGAPASSSATHTNCRAETYRRKVRETGCRPVVRTTNSTSQVVAIDGAATTLSLTATQSSCAGVKFAPTTFGSSSFKSLLKRSRRKPPIGGDRATAASEREPCCCRGSMRACSHPNCTKRYPTRNRDWTLLGGTFDPDKLRKQITELEARQQAPGFWDDARSAQADMRKLSALRARIEPYDSLSKAHD